jgi:predicted metallopeptidase
MRTKKEVHYSVGDLIVESMIREIVVRDKTFSHVTIDHVKIISIEGKKRKVPVVIHGMKEPLNLLVPFKYVLYVYSDTFYDLSETKQITHVYRAMVSMSDEFDGSVKRKDVSDYSEIIAKLGVFWQYENDDFLEGRLGISGKPKSGSEANAKEDSSEDAEDLEEQFEL